MQKENLEQSSGQSSEALLATSENQTDSGESIAKSEATVSSGEKSDCAADSKREFEKLIKGQYKEAFDERVQGIINKRFKESKKAEASAKTKVNTVTLEQEEKKPPDNAAAKENKENRDNEYSLRAAEIVAMGYKDFELAREMENPTFKALVDGGVDLLTAYQALHIDEIMDSSVRFGAEKAAKQMADSIRFKVGRPSENGLTNRVGFGTRKGVSGLTPKQRKELAKKALMGEEVGF